MHLTPLRALVALALLGTMGLAAPTSTAEATPGDRVRVIVELKDRSSQDTVVASVRDASKVRKTRTMPYVIMQVPRAALNGLRNNPHVKAVTEDTAQPFALEDSVPVINGDDVHTLGHTGAGATVAVLDNGIDADHPFYAGRVVAQHCFSDPGDDDGDNAQESLCPDGTTEDNSADIEAAAACNNTLCSHGTHVAGIAVGSASTGGAGNPGNGVAPGANLIGVQVFTRFNNATDCSPNAAPCTLAFTSDQILGLDWVNGQAVANPGWRVVSANMSLGGGNFATACDGDTRKASIDTLLGNGVATVIASGNNSFLNSVGAPGCISTAFTVGRTNNDDTTTNSGNRGPLLDVMAPGSSITSSVPDDGYGDKSGTSMSTPHVAGALAVLRAAAPARPINDLLNDITSTGVPITYDTAADGSTQNTTPRLNLLAALQSSNQPPTLTVDNASVTVPEGTEATNSGSYADADGSVVSITADLGAVSFAGGTWSWSHTPQDDLAATTVTVTATDDKGETGTTTFSLEATNVAPTVVVTSVSTADENAETTVTATFSDPGTLDTHSVEVDWGDGLGFQPVADTTSPISATHTYGDDGAFTVTVRVSDDDGGTGSDSGTATVGNVAPTAAITGPATTTWNGEEIIFAEAGTPVTFEGHSDDPGSDDLRFDWSFGDGASDSNEHLNNPPAADPDPSPEINPRSVDDSSTHTYAVACARTLDLAVTDDDAGSASDSAQVVVLGTADDAEGHGWWQSEFRGTKKPTLSQAKKDCLVSVVGVLSLVFDETRDAGSVPKTADVLFLHKNVPPVETFDAHLMTLWLNVANGAVGLDDPIDVTVDGTHYATVGALITAAEAERNAPAPSDVLLLAFKDAFVGINEG